VQLKKTDNGRNKETRPLPNETLPQAEQGPRAMPDLPTRRLSNDRARRGDGRRPGSRGIDAREHPAGGRTI